MVKVGRVEIQLMLEEGDGKEARERVRVLVMGGAVVGVGVDETRLTVLVMKMVDSLVMVVAVVGSEDAGSEEAGLGLSVRYEAERMGWTYTEGMTTGLPPASLGVGSTVIVV